MSYKYMKYIKLSPSQINILEDAINYNPDEDENGSRGRCLADLLNLAFNGAPPRISQLNKEKLVHYNILSSQDYKELYRKGNKSKFKSLFRKLKQAGYKGPDGTEMKNSSKMDAVQMINYLAEIRQDLNIF